eukprot:6598559-Prorocentrum_lima.AAC.1
MSVPNDDSEGYQGAEPRRSLGLTCKSVLGKVKEDAIVLPGVLQGSPFHLEVVQVWDAYDGRSVQKKSWLSAKVAAMSFKSI